MTSVLIGIIICPCVFFIYLFVILLYINETVNCFTDNDIKLFLYADDTNIFITGDSKQNLIEKANNVLIKVNKFMKSHLLHINLGKCCFIFLYTLTQQLNATPLMKKMKILMSILKIMNTNRMKKFLK